MAGRDPFEVFGIQPDFDLDLDRLEPRYRELSRALHPDRFSGSPAAERRMALGHAIEVNEAWRTLRDPVRRAQVLLQRLGVPVGEETESVSDPDLLMKIMEYRERLALAQQSRNREELRELEASAQKEERSACEVLAQAFRRALETREVDGRFLSSRLAELCYYRRFLEAVDLAAEEVSGSD